MEFISRLDATKHKMTFDGTVIGYIDTRGAFRMSGNKKSYLPGPGHNSKSYMKKH
jgi:hypothetical protein